MLPPNVTLLSSQSSPYITPGNTTGTQTVYRFMVGEQGPFTVTLRGTDDTPANVQAAVTNRINALRELGVNV